VASLATNTRTSATAELALERVGVAERGLQLCAESPMVTCSRGHASEGGDFAAVTPSMAAPSRRVNGQHELHARPSRTETTVPFKTTLTP
jgi:hypothetical protein